MKDSYNWYDPAHPRGGYYEVEIPTNRAEVFNLISHLKKSEDRQWLMEAFEEGNMFGGVRQGLQFMQDAATERRSGPEKYIPPTE